jgi:integrase
MPRPASGQVLERAGKRGRVVFAIRYRVPGHGRVYETTTAATREEADAKLRHTLADVERGIWRPPVKEQPYQAPLEERTFHVAASEWVAERRDELEPRSIEALEWALSHVLGGLAEYPPSTITAAMVDSYRRAKLHEGSLSKRSINRTIAVLGQVLDDVLEDGAPNPARGKKRRLKAGKPERIWLELDELRSLLAAAGDHRALLATMAMAGLRVSEACNLYWRDVDLASGRVHVAQSKTDAGRRTVELSPDLLDELKALKARSPWQEPDELVFPTRNGTKRDRHNVRSRVLLPVLARTNKVRAKAELRPIAHITSHMLRRTFASLLYAAGASPAYVMGAMGHESAALALEVYAKMMARQSNTGAAMDELVRGPEWAQMGTNGNEVHPSVASFDALERENAAS